MTRRFEMKLITLFYKSRNISCDWARPFPADASSPSRANEGPASSALPWPMAYRPWALAEMTRRRPFVGTGRLVVICRKLLSDRVDFG